MTQRNIATCIVLSIFTCGIYGIIWFINLTDDVKTASGDDSMPSGGIAFLLTLVTCGIYGIYWAYRMGKGLQMAKQKAGNQQAEDNSILYLVLQFFGLAIVNYALIQNELNGIVKSHWDAAGGANNNDAQGTPNVA